MRKTLHVECINPPIPVRQFDWVAWWDGEEETGHYGYGKTHYEAIEELLQQDAAEDAMQWLDCQLGGDGEYYFNTLEPDNCPCDPTAMAKIIAERVPAQIATSRREGFEAARMGADGIFAQFVAYKTERPDDDKVHMLTVTDLRQAIRSMPYDREGA